MLFPRKIRAGALLAALTLLAGCATVTPYQPMAHGEGYADQRIEASRYRIVFAGNSMTPRQTVENYLLFRAAELTLQEGYDYFRLSNNDTDSQTHYQESVSAFTGFGCCWPHTGFGFGIGTAYPITEYQSQAFITMYKGKRPPDQADAFDAREVRNNLGPLIHYPEKKS